jgi:serine/threonine-protein kinase
MDADDWYELVRKSKLVDSQFLSDWRIRCTDCADVRTLVTKMIGEGLLTEWQSEKLLAGKWKGFFVDHYCIRQKLGQDDIHRTLLFEALDMRDRTIAILSVVPPSRKLRDDGGLIYSVRPRG